MEITIVETWKAAGRVPHYRKSEESSRKILYTSNINLSSVNNSQEQSRKYYGALDMLIRAQEKTI